MAAEKARLATRRASRGWLLWIIPGGIILFVLLCFVLQKVTNIPFYDVLGLGDCTMSAISEDSENDEAMKAMKKKCDERLNMYTPGQRNAARIAIVVAVLVVVYFLFEVFGGGIASGFYGGSAGKMVDPIRPALRDEAGYAQKLINDAHKNAEYAMRTQHMHLPKGTTDTATVHTSHVHRPQVHHSQDHHAQAYLPQDSDYVNRKALDLARRTMGDILPSDDTIGDSGDDQMFNAVAHI